MEVVREDPNMISTMDKCDIEDQYTTQDSSNDIWNISEDHKIDYVVYYGD